MNTTSISLEIAVAVLGVIVLLLDLWLPKEDRRWLGYGAAAVLGLLLFVSFNDDIWDGKVATAFHGAYVLDATAIFFKRFFLVAAILVLVMAAEFADRFASGVPEYFSLILFALTGMMFASSANDFMMLFASIELITVTFYVLVSFQRERTQSLEAGVKYLILGALSSGVLVYGIALVYGASGTMSFEVLDVKLKASHDLGHSGLFRCGALMVLAGLAFKLAVVPFQFWAPDVYQGAPAPTTAFLAVGSKAAGVALLARLVWSALPEVAWELLEKPFIVATALTILYGSLCAIPQRNLKRLIAYSSIASVGYIMLGFSTLTTGAFGAIAYYLGAWLFAVLAVFAVVCVVSRATGSDDIASLAGLKDRSPLLAVALTLAMISLAGVPPLAGFLGKFMILRAVVEDAVAFQFTLHYKVLLAIAVIGVLISLYYCLGVVRVIWWSKDTADLTPLQVTRATRCLLIACIAGMLWLGTMPATPLRLVAEATPLVK